MNIFAPGVETEIDSDILIDEQDEDTAKSYHTTIFNDDVNSFEYVISLLMHYCQHTTEQAEQSATIIHHKGKHTVKSGTKDEMTLLVTSLCDNGLDARLDVLEEKSE